MASRVEVFLVDDVDGSAAVETVTFALDGVSYEIDLNDSHAAELRAAVQRWVGHARRSGGRKHVGRAKSSSSLNPQQRADIRAWARAHGHTIGEKGRIAASIQEAYASAHQ